MYRIVCVCLGKYYIQVNLFLFKYNVFVVVVVVVFILYAPTGHMTYIAQTYKENILEMGRYLFHDLFMYLCVHTYLKTYVSMHVYMFNVGQQ